MLLGKVPATLAEKISLAAELALLGILARLDALTAEARLDMARHNLEYAVANGFVSEAINEALNGLYEAEDRYFGGTDVDQRNGYLPCEKAVLCWISSTWKASSMDRPLLIVKYDVRSMKFLTQFATETGTDTTGRFVSIEDAIAFLRTGKEPALVNPVINWSKANLTEVAAKLSESYPDIPRTNCTAKMFAEITQ